MSATASSPKRIAFLTGTRADFGKLKSLIQICRNSEQFEVHLFATGMHLHQKYGRTVEEIEKSGFDNIFQFINQTSEESMDLTLAKTVEGFSNFCREFHPDLIVIHGDRVEALAGAIVGALNNILVAHVEGGEVSGTIDELIRHAVSKLSHTHFVSNDKARQRLLQMGEDPSSVFVIGSPDVDIMLSDKLPTFEEAAARYDIPFADQDYGVLMFHPVTTEANDMASYADNLVQAVIASNENYVVIYPNNDIGSSDILRAYQALSDLPQFRTFPSIRFEYFLVLLKHAKFMLGNSSAGVREAPYYGLPSINIGTRQQNRSLDAHIFNCDYTESGIASAITEAVKMGRFTPSQQWGNGKSDALFFEAISSPTYWQVSKQKLFCEIPNIS